MTLPLDQILTGDARELIELIPDESIDLIFTDPVYSHIDDYEWVAREAERVLKLDRACLAWYGGPNLDTVIATMRQHLTWVWPLKYTVIAKSYRLIAYNIFTWPPSASGFARGKGSLIGASLIPSSALLPPLVPTSGTRMRALSASGWMPLQ